MYPEHFLSEHIKSYGTGNLLGPDLVCPDHLDPCFFVVSSFEVYRYPLKAPFKAVVMHMTNRDVIIFVYF